MKNTLGENWNSEKILNPKTLKSMSDITVINNEVNDILSNTSDNSDYWKYIWEVRYDSEIDDFEELKSRIFEAIKINVDFYWDFEDFKITILKPVLLYDQILPSGCTCGNLAMSLTIWLRASAPGPKSLK